jgi:hypothetical protein
MHPDEEDPHRTVQNKNAIHKVMFYSGIIEPRFDAEGRCYFDGKLGLWPFVRDVEIWPCFILVSLHKNLYSIISHKNLCTFRNRHKEKVQQAQGHSYHEDNEG